MIRSDWIRAMGPVAGLVACMCVGVTALVVSNMHLARRMLPDPHPVKQAADTPESPRSLPRVELPEPDDRKGAAIATKPKSMATPEEQAAAGNQVIARAMVQALGEAAAIDNPRAVEQLLRGLPKYGEAATRAIQEELGRVRSPKARDALLKALDSLGS